MSTNKTPVLNLHSWVGTDKFIRAEFNDNFSVIDEQVGVILATAIDAGMFDDENDMPAVDGGAF